MEIIDVNGRPHSLTQYQVQMILVIGWVSFLLSWICNIIYYKFHPSGVDFNVGRSKSRFFIYFLGRKVKLPGYKREKEVDEFEDTKEDKQNTDKEGGGDEKEVKDSEVNDQKKTVKMEVGVEKKV